MVITPAHPDADDSVYSYPVVRYRSLDLRDKTGYMAGVPFSPELARKLSKENVALLHSHCPIVSTILARQLRQIVDAPLVLTYHTKFDIDIANIIRNRALQAGSKKALLDNINACDEVWTVSQGAGENLRSLGYEGDYIVMPNGVDLPCQRVPVPQINAVTAGHDLPAGVPVFLFVGRMMWYKGIRLILDALARLKAVNRDFRMVFIGDGADRAEIEAQAESWNISDKCLFIGSVHQREDLRAWYCRADLFLFPSTFDTNGLVVREAAACSVAAVLIKDSCAAEGIKNGVNGFLIEENASSLYNCLLQLYDDMALMHQVGENASHELYVSWETAVQSAMHRYEIVIDRYLCGAYPSHRKPSEEIMKANGELMDGLGHLLTLRDQIRRHIRDSLN